MTDELNKDIIKLKKAESALVGHIESVQKYSEQCRFSKENEWLQAMRDVRGEHSPEQLKNIARLKETNPLASTAFIRVTATKSLAAYGNMLEILFSNKEFPILIEPTPIPDGVSEIATITVEGGEDSEETPVDTIGFDGDGIDVPAGADHRVLGGLKKKFDKLLSSGARVVSGPAGNPQTDIEIHPAMETAANMHKQLQDQLLEMDAETKLSHALWEATHLGTGAIKGPFSINRVKEKWIQEEDGTLTYSPETYLAPEIMCPSIWNLYPDPGATSMANAGYMVERHLLVTHQLRQWLTMPKFNTEAITAILDQGNPHYERKHWESELLEEDFEAETAKYEVLEYWGFVDNRLAQDLGLTFKESDNIQINAFVCNGRLLKAVLNPFVPAKIPYHLASYNRDPYSLWGTGIPFNNRDTQQIVNAHWRAAQDNLNLSGNLILEVDDQKLVSGQNFTIHPGKIFHTRNGLGQAVRDIKLGDTSQSHFMAVDKAMQFGDDATGIPRFFTGSGNLGSAIRTASQTSMLMGATALNIKTVIKNIDKQILEPLGKSLFNWNMQFNKNNPSIRGDIQIKAGGTSSLMQKEVKSQRLMTYAQVATTNPIMMATTDWEYFQKEIAKANDLDPNKVINSPNKARENAMLMQLSQGANNANQQGAGNAAQSAGNESGMGSGSRPPPGANPADVSGNGGGNIGTGSIPMPGESGFTG